MTIKLRLATTVASIYFLYYLHGQPQGIWWIQASQFVFGFYTGWSAYFLILSSKEE